uniref:Uncharacterized protein n=1 Tax=Alexandrium monilatum TaxID=311494 RepID=A0A7S4VII2_9DINO
MQYSKSAIPSNFLPHLKPGQHSCGVYQDGPLQGWPAVCSSGWAQPTDSPCFCNCTLLSPALCSISSLWCCTAISASPACTFVSMWAATVGGRKVQGDGVPCGRCGNNAQEGNKEAHSHTDL